jgi:phosphatidylethanolamine/phosphatidyl-N-methylethanolamine N-methyltransferase
VKLSHSWRLFRGYLREPRVVGALTPSSRALALALCEPYRRYRGAARVLEVGAGTGAVTQHLGPMLKGQDRLDVCEIRRDFAEILERDVFSQPSFIPAVESGRIRLLCQPVQQLAADEPYDFIISALPFTSFDLQDVRTIFEVIQRCLKPGGVFSYFEYVGLRRTSAILAVGRGRDRIRSVSAFLSQSIRAHQFAERMVLSNVPPARTRYLRFRSNGA